VRRHGVVAFVVKLYPVRARLYHYRFTTRQERVLTIVE